MMDDTVVRCVEVARAVNQVVQKSAMPRLPRIDAPLEADTAVRGSSSLGLRPCLDLQASHEVLIAIGGAQLLLRVRAVGGDAATADNSVGLHLEHVGEVRA